MRKTKKKEKPIFAKNIIARRKILGWNGHKLAEKARIPYPTLRDIEAGYNHGREETKLAIASALGVPMAELYEEHENGAVTPLLSGPNPDDLVALGGGFALSSEGRRALGLYILTKDDSYYRRALAIPDVAPIALMLKKSLLSS